MNSALGKATVKAVAALVQELGAMNVPDSGRHRSKIEAQVKQETETRNDIRKQETETQKIVQALKQTAGKVLATINKTTIIVSLGSNQGFKSGDKLILYQPDETKNEKGDVVFVEEKLVGEVRLEAVQEDRSKATYDGAAEVKSGWIVKAK